MIFLIFIFRPPIIRVSDKVMIPQDDHPDINFVGLLIGPRGNTLKCKSTILIKLRSHCDVNRTACQPYQFVIS